jgi:hypothetical protein
VLICVGRFLFFCFLFLLFFGLLLCHPVFDGMAIVRKLGKADLFLTFTAPGECLRIVGMLFGGGCVWLQVVRLFFLYSMVCIVLIRWWVCRGCSSLFLMRLFPSLNPQWPEIVQSLRPGQQAMDRYDVVCRVFNLKVLSLLADLRAGALGKPIARMHVVEWQKRGLPHVHLLLWLAPEDRMRSPADYDAVVCAEIPDSEREPELHALVMAHMIHVPCHNKTGKRKPACILPDGRCKARFPKKRQLETMEDGDGYPLYRRRMFRRYVYPGTGELVDDGSVAPYNRALLWRYATHLNVEVCSTLHAVKYLHKYIHKGGDRSVTALENPQTVVESLDAHADVPAQGTEGEQQASDDEIRRYLEGRYISTGEAVWRALEFCTHAVRGCFSITVSLFNRQCLCRFMLDVCCVCLSLSLFMGLLA